MDSKATTGTRTFEDDCKAAERRERERMIYVNRCRKCGGTERDGGGCPNCEYARFDGFPQD